MTWICPTCDRDVEDAVCPECGRAYDSRVAVFRLGFGDGQHAIIEINARKLSQGLKRAQKALERFK